MADINMKSLLETGVHFGHRTRKWNPRMKPYIFTERNGIHIIDLQQTLEAFMTASALITKKVADGGTILFVGTKRQAQETIELEATRCSMPYVNSRWLGGTLTNWRTIRSRITELENLEKRRDEGEFELLTKKEALTMRRRIDRLEERLGGIRNMKGLPNLLFIVDVRREETAIHEANLLDIPVIALVDTNCDPSGVDYVIPSNDDAIRAIKLLTAKIADSVMEGKAMRKDVEEEFEVAEGVLPEVREVELSDEELLGEATLAKLQSGDYDEKRRVEYEAEEVEEDAEEEVEGEELDEPEESEDELDDDEVDSTATESGQDEEDLDDDEYDEDNDEDYDDDGYDEDNDEDYDDEYDDYDEEEEE
jgi:small subunit ribosomal protein S2